MKNSKVFGLVLIALMLLAGWLSAKVMVWLGEIPAIICYVGGLMFSHYRWVMNPMSASKEAMAILFPVRKIVNLGGMCASGIFVGTLIAAGFSVLWLGLVTAGVMYVMWLNSATYQLYGLTE